MNNSKRTFVFRIIANTFAALAGAYGLSVSGFLVLRALIGEASGIIGFFNNFLHLLLFPSLLLLPLFTGIALLRRRMGILLLIMTQIPAALTFILRYGGLFVPHASSPAANALTVFTYNIHGESRDVSGMIAAIRGSGADVVAVQELSVFAEQNLRPALRDIYPYMALYPGTARPTHGQGIFSRHPIVEEEYWQNRQFTDALGHLRALIDLNGTRIAFYNTHPIHPGMTGSFYNDDGRGAEIDVVLTRAARERVPVVILGDFNMGEWSDDYARITMRYTDVHRAVGYGLGLTFPEWSRADSLPGFRPQALPLPPLLRLDYVFVSGLRPIDALVWHTAGGSDHYPLLVRLGL